MKHLWCVFGNTALFQPSSWWLEVLLKILHYFNLFVWCFNSTVSKTAPELDVTIPPCLPVSTGFLYSSKRLFLVVNFCRFWSRNLFLGQRFLGPWWHKTHMRVLETFSGHGRSASWPSKQIPCQLKVTVWVFFLTKLLGLPLTCTFQTNHFDV